MHDKTSIWEYKYISAMYEDFIEQIMSLVESPKPLKILYLDSLKQFGRKDGLKIYRKVKQVI